MQRLRLVEQFSQCPRACLVLAALFLVIGVLFANDWIGTSLNRPYFPAHEWVMTALCLASGAFFVYCAVDGLRKRRVKLEQ